MSDSADFISDLTKTSASQIAEALHRAYERGLSDGRRIAADQFKERIVLALNADVAFDDEIKPHGKLVEHKTPMPASYTLPHHSVPPTPPQRAPRGSVEPAVLDALRTASAGKKPGEIATEKGIPENSVRGMLNKLKHDGRARKIGEAWFVTDKDGFVPVDLTGNENPGAEDAGE